MAGPGKIGNLKEELRSVQAEKETLCGQLDASKKYRDRLDMNMNIKIKGLQEQLSSDRLTAFKKNKDLLKHKPVLVTKNENAAKERDAASMDQEAMKKERDAANSERYTANYERDIAIQKWYAARMGAKTMKKEMDAANQERDTANQERDISNLERDTANEEKDAAIMGEKTMKKERGAAKNERDISNQERDTANDERDTAKQERDTAIQERDATQMNVEDLLKIQTSIEKRLEESEETNKQMTLAQADSKLHCKDCKVASKRKSELEAKIKDLQMYQWDTRQESPVLEMVMTEIRRILRLRRNLQDPTASKIVQLLEGLSALISSHVSRGCDIETHYQKQRNDLDIPIRRHKNGRPLPAGQVEILEEKRYPREAIKEDNEFRLADRPKDLCDSDIDSIEVPKLGGSSIVTKSDDDEPKTPKLLPIVKTRGHRHASTKGQPFDRQVHWGKDISRDLRRHTEGQHTYVPTYDRS